MKWGLPDFGKWKRTQEEGGEGADGLEQRPAPRWTWKRLMALSFAAALSFCFVLGVFLPIRPSYSDSEKRPLKTLPILAWDGLVSGQYFTDLAAWFSDTYPFRESFLQGNARLEGLYGLRGEAIYRKSDAVSEEIPSLSAETAPTLSLDDFLKPAAGGAGEDAAEDSDSASGFSGEAAAADAALVSVPGNGDDAGNEGSLLSAAGDGMGNPVGLAGEDIAPGQGEAQEDTPSGGVDGQDASPAEDAGQAEDVEAGGDPGKEDREIPETNADGALMLPDIDTAGVVLAGQQVNEVYVSHNKGYEIYYFSQKNMTDYASMMNTVRALLPEQVNFYSMVVPSAFGIGLPPEEQEKLSTSGMGLATEYIYSLLDERIHTVPVYEAVLAHKDEYVFFNTDHHWTQLGAYYAYRAFCETKGLEAHALSDYEHRSYSGFYGSFYFATNRAEALRQNPDTIEAYLPISTNALDILSADGAESRTSVIGNADNLTAGNKYSCFIMGDNGLSRIENPLLQDGSAVVLVKDSFGNCFAPFLVDHYQYTYVVDYRYFAGNFLQLIAEKGIQDVVFMHCIGIVGLHTARQVLEMFD